MLPGERTTERIDQLKVVGVKARCECHIPFQEVRFIVRVSHCHYTRPAHEPRTAQPPQRNCQGRASGTDSRNASDRQTGSFMRLLAGDSHLRSAVLRHQLYRHLYLTHKISGCAAVTAPATAAALESSIARKTSRDPHEACQGRAGQTVSFNRLLGGAASFRRLPLPEGVGLPRRTRQWFPCIGSPRICQPRTPRSLRVCTR